MTLLQILFLSPSGVADWAQGEVTKLFSQISSNGKNNNNDMIMMTMKMIISGYKILYLSARSISQAADTKAYLQSLR